jgi:hypothetical protein
MKCDERIEMSETLSENEVETLRTGATGAALLVSVSDRGFFDTFKEAGTLARHVTAARRNSHSAVVRQVAEGRGVGIGVTTSPHEIEVKTLDALRASVELLQAKAPDEIEAYRSFVLELARSVAAAAPGGEEVEASTISKIETALAASGKAQPSST